MLVSKSREAGSRQHNRKSIPMKKKELNEKKIVSLLIAFVQSQSSAVAKQKLMDIKLTGNNLC